MDFCGTPLWDLSLTWDTQNPDFTPCFHNTVLIYVPVIFLLFFSPLEIYFLRRSQSRNIPWCVLNILRLSVGALLVILALAELVLIATLEREMFIADILGPIVKILGFSFSLFLSKANIKMGLQSSAILFSYWALTATAQSITFASVVRFGDEPHQVVDSTVFSTELALVAAMCFLQFWADPSPQDKSLDNQSDNPSPALGSSFPNKLTFTWFGSILKKGWKRPLNETDLYDLNPSEQAEVNYSQWDKQWTKCEEKILQNRSKDQVSIFKPLFLTFGVAFLISSFIQLMAVMLTQISPQALNLLIGFTSSEEEIWKDYLYIILLVGINLVKTILNYEFYIKQMLIG